MTNKERARAYFSAVNRYDVEAIGRMVDENYIQHNPRVPTGRAAFLALIPKLAEAGSRIVNRRLFADGRYVIMHHQWLRAGPFGHERAVAFHIIRFDDRARIAEHWNVMRRDDSPGAPATSLADGVTENSEPHRTEESRARAKEWFDERARREPGRYRQLHRIFAEGNFALSIAEGRPGGTAHATYDLLRIESGSVAGHWQIAQAIPPDAANDNTMFGF